MSYYSTSFPPNDVVSLERRGRASLSEFDLHRGGVSLRELDPGPSVSEVVSEVGVKRDEVEKRGSVA